jgi:hypothetical protein
MDRKHNRYVVGQQGDQGTHSWYAGQVDGASQVEIQMLDSRKLKGRSVVGEESARKNNIFPWNPTRPGIAR